ncbi:MAG: ABC transporter ATP-binding protein [Oscillospiraceae bacterium]|nr:ABC transporter ATP-binding protein [Oscillospiraceae bacterium]
MSVDNILETRNLKKYFSSPNGIVHAVDDVSFSIPAGQTMGIVGESGCGKTTLGRVLIHLIEPTSGQIVFKGEDITSVTPQRLGQLREKMQIIFQDPFSSLDPRMYIEQLIGEAMRGRKYKRGEINRRTLELMDTVGIPKRLIYAYPHELDGGLRQRVVIARALALEPEFIVCDEPVSALDVSIQAQVLNLLNELQEAKKLTYMFITHDLSVVRYISNCISVMYLGQVIEQTDSDSLFAQPLHPYTKALLAAVPVPRLTEKKKPPLIHGEVTSPIDPPAGCRFVPRCPYACEECKKPQTLREVISGHLVSCCRAEEINQLNSRKDEHT